MQLQKLFESLPWYIKAPAGIGGAIVGHFADQFPPWVTPYAIIGGFGLFAWVGAAFIWHAINHWRVEHAKSPLTLEPSHVILLGLVIAGVGTLWQWRQGSSPEAQVAELRSEVDTLTKQLTASKAGNAPAAAALSPLRHPLTPKEEEALQSLSSILNRNGGEVLRFSEKPLMRLNPTIGFEGTPPTQIRDNFQQIAVALSSMETTLYREFLPANRYYKTELLAALGTTSDNVVDSPVYKYLQYVGSFVGAMNTIVSISDEAKNPQITAQTMNFAYQRYQEFQEKNTAFKNWIEDCNARIEQRKAEK